MKKRDILKISVVLIIFFTMFSFVNANSFINNIFDSLKPNNIDIAQIKEDIRVPNSLVRLAESTNQNLQRNIVGNNSLFQKQESFGYIIEFEKEPIVVKQAYYFENVKLTLYEEQEEKPEEEIEEELEEELEEEEEQEQEEKPEEEIEEEIEEELEEELEEEEEQEEKPEEEIEEEEEEKEIEEEEEEKEIEEEEEEKEIEEEPEEEEKEIEEEEEEVDEEIEEPEEEIEILTRIRITKTDVIDFEEESDIVDIEIRKKLISLEVEDKINRYKEELKSENNRVINEITNTLDGLRNNNRIRIFGSSRQKVEVIEEFNTVFNGIVMDISLEEAKEIQKIPGVKRVHPNLKVEILLDNSVPVIQNNISAGQLDEDGNDCTVSGKQCLTGKNVTIAIIDTGVDYTHPDLGGCFGVGCKVIGGYNFIKNDTDIIDDNYHGTHCAGIAASNGSLKGVAPDANILAYKVFDSRGRSKSSYIVAAIEKAVEDDADIISLSLGGSGTPESPMSQAVDNAVLAGKSVVVSAGNEGPSNQTIRTPGTARNAITVGAVTNNKRIVSFSSRGPVVWFGGKSIKPDVLAPGLGICSARAGNFRSENVCEDENYIRASGTSMSAPHVAGAIAILKQKNPEFTPSEIKNLIKMNADDLGYDKFFQGAGLINLTSSLSSSLVIDGDLFFDVNFDYNIYERDINITNLKNETLEVSISITDATDDNKETANVLTVNETEIEIPPLSNKVVRFQLNITETELEGFSFGEVIFETPNKNFQIFYDFYISSILKLELTDHFPNYVIFDDSLENVYTIEQSTDFVGDKITIKLPSGEYTLIMVNEDIDEDSPMKEEYFIIKRVSVPVKGEAEYVFDLSEEKLFTFEAKSKEGRDLELFLWNRGFYVYTGNFDNCSIYSETDEETCVNNPEGWNCYYELDECKDRVLGNLWISNFRYIPGDINMYISENPSQEFGVDIGVIVEYGGVPI